MTTVIEFMHNVAEEIIAIQTNRDKSIDDLWQEFYTIMRKYGIKQGIKNPEGNGILTSNYEWTMCVSLFIDQITNHIHFDNIFDEVPEDLCYY